MTAKPDKLIDWANDETYPAGADPWSGTPTKIRPSATVRAKGWRPTYPPAAQHLNYMFHHLINGAYNGIAQRLGNWQAVYSVADVTTPGEPLAGCYVQARKTLVAVLKPSGGAPRAIESADGGMVWRDAPSPAITSTASDLPTDVASSQGVVVVGIDGSVAGRYSSGGAWATITGLGTKLARVAGSELGSSPIFIGADLNGKLWRSFDGAAWSELAGAPSFGEPVRQIAPPFDGDCPRWLVLTEHQAAVSLDDGASWLVAEHGLSAVPTAPKSLAFDGASDRWILLTGGQGLALSTDGLHWQALETALPRSVSGATMAIISEGRGELLVAATSPTDKAIFGSVDGGATWFEGLTPCYLEGSGLAVGYNAKRFSVLTYQAPNLVGAYSFALPG